MILGGPVRPALVGREQDLGLDLLHVVDVLAERPAAGVIDFEHFAAEVLVEDLVDDGQDDGALEMLVDLGADGQVLVVFLVDRVADLVGAGRIVDLDVAGPLAGGLAIGQLFRRAPGSSPASARPASSFSMKAISSGVTWTSVLSLSMVSLYLPIKASMIAFWAWRRFSAWSKTMDRGPSKTSAETSSPAVGGEAVHEDAVGLGLGHQGVVDLVGGEEPQALLLFRFLAHGGPDVGVDGVGAADGFGRVVGDRGARSRCPWPSSRASLTISGFGS